MHRPAAYAAAHIIGAGAGAGDQAGEPACSLEGLQHLGAPPEQHALRLQAVGRA